MGKLGEKPSSWVADWARENRHEPSDVTTTNDVIIERKLTAYKLRVLTERYADVLPKPIDPSMPINRRAFWVSDWDTFFDIAAEKGEDVGTRPERLGPAPTPAHARMPEPASEPTQPSPPEPPDTAQPEPAPIPAPRQAHPPQSKVGRLLATNAKARAHLDQRIAAYNGVQAEIDRLTRQILDIDQGTGEPAREARRQEIEAVREKIKALAIELRALEKADRQANAYSEDDLPGLRDELQRLRREGDLIYMTIQGDRADIELRHGQIMREAGAAEALELPAIEDTPETTRLYREMASGRLTTIPGAAHRLGVDVQKLRDGNKRWSSFPPAVAKHPDGRSGNLYEFAKIEQAAKAHGLVYSDEESAA